MTGQLPQLQRYYADLHIHIGQTEKGAAVKISASRNLTFANIAREASERKGIHLTGIIDCHAPHVQEDIRRYLEDGSMTEIEGGGIAYKNTVILLGSEIEIREGTRPEAHVLAFFPNLASITDFSGWMSRRMKNVNLSSQRLYAPPRELQAEIYGRGGIMIPAHIFTPHKGIYGSSAMRMAELLDLDRISAVELGLSADSEMAGYISELDCYSFLTNSDAHSLGKIGREYNELLLATPSFAELRLALERKHGRKVVGNYGLNPRLGKYHRSFCTGCGTILDEEEIAADRCPACGHPKLVRGVFDRILNIADRAESCLPDHRPPYIYQVPLEFIPGLGKVKLNLLLERFGTEMNILHEANEEAIAAVVGPELGRSIVMAREGRLQLIAGGGGTYGRIDRSGGFAQN
ncbi:endonuclease Q family protein [Paenibacillus sp. P96]|uniref:Endonuclease Q family protein n=2 Tax=Paenibacillus zeirhizosphaerae TaxID=2987519 RepID=A0ABT9FPR3_9BACL|nr:endonuclease Q family protein [Paenibacillus sp. P96]MDP4096712.1 endonuclease Q family protein [Paenibacillus sp. P96]